MITERCACPILLPYLQELSISHAAAAGLGVGRHIPEESGTNFKQAESGQAEGRGQTQGGDI